VYENHYFRPQRRGGQAGVGRGRGRGLDWTSGRLRFRAFVCCCIRSATTTADLAGSRRLLHARADFCSRASRAGFHRHDGAKPHRRQLHRCDASTSDGAAGSAERAANARPRVGAGLLELAEQPISMDGGPLGRAAAFRRSMGAATLAGGGNFLALLRGILGLTLGKTLMRKRGAIRAFFVGGNLSCDNASIGKLPIRILAAQARTSHDWLCRIGAYYTRPSGNIRMRSPSIAG
jgi:hypothetical protein